MKSFCPTGEEILVTRNGKPFLVRLVAAWADVNSKAQRARGHKALKRLAQLRHGVGLEGDLQAIARAGLD